MVLHNGVLFGMVLKSPSAVRILKYRLLWAAHIARLEQMTTQNNEQQVRGNITQMFGKQAEDGR
jgi:hypothetical protein